MKIKLTITESRTTEHVIEYDDSLKIERVAGAHAAEMYADGYVVDGPTVLDDGLASIGRKVEPVTFLGANHCDIERVMTHQIID